MCLWLQLNINPFTQLDIIYIIIHSLDLVIDENMYRYDMECEYHNMIPHTFSSCRFVLWGRSVLISTRRDCCSHVYLDTAIHLPRSNTRLRISQQQWHPAGNRKQVLANYAQVLSSLRPADDRVLHQRHQSDFPRSHHTPTSALHLQSF